MAKISVPDIDSRNLTFGKYKGMTPDQVGDVDPQYIVWAFENIKPEPCSKQLYNACQLLVDEIESDSTEDDFPSW